MNHFKKYKGTVLKAAFAGLLVPCLMTSQAQRKPAIVDLQLGTPEITDVRSAQVNTDALLLNQSLLLKMQVGTLINSEVLPVGSCKLKIGLGSKAVLDPAFNLSDVGMDNYFRWSVVTADGQSFLTGELTAPLPSDRRNLTLNLRLKTTEAGSSTITANFLVTNHNTQTIVSDQDGSNNAVSLKYTVTEKLAPADDNAELVLSLYPNPVRGEEVNIHAVKGKFSGRYRFSLLDASGKTVVSREQKMEDVKVFKLASGHLAAGKYLVQVLDVEKAKSFALRFEKL
jgi:hypothetical protein